MFPLDNSTRAFTASFLGIFLLWEDLVVLKGPRNLVPLELMFSSGLGLSQQLAVPPLLVRARVY